MTLGRQSSFGVSAALRSFRRAFSMLPSRGRDPYTNAPLSFSRVFSQRGRSASGGGGGEEEGEDGREGGGKASEVEGVSDDNEQQQQKQKQRQHQKGDGEGHRGLFKHVSLLPRRHSPSPIKAVPRSVSHTGFEHGWQGDSEYCCAVDSIPEDALEVSLSFSTEEGSKPKQVAGMEAEFSAMRSRNQQPQGVKA